MASLEAGLPIFVAILIISSLLNAAYYFPIVITAFFTGGAEDDEPAKAHAAEHAGGVHDHREDTGHGDDHDTHDAHGPKERKDWKEAPWHMVIPMGILAVGCVIFALLPVNWPWELALQAARLLFSM